MRFIDLTQEATGWLGADDPVAKFTEWAGDSPPWVRTDFSWIRARPGEGEFAAVVEARMPDLRAVTEPLLASLADGEWRERVGWTIGRAESVLGGEVDYVDVIVGLGLGAHNAAMGYWRGRGLAYLCMEHFMEPGTDSPFLDLGSEALPIWLAHELGHAIRYATPGTGSPVPWVCGAIDPWEMWPIFDRIPLGEHFLDEGLATAFAGAVVVGASEAEILGMNDAELAWLDENGKALLRDRTTSWDLAAWDPPDEWIGESLWLQPDRREPPWTLANPPGRWGYYAGYRHVARPREADWVRLLTQPCSAPFYREP